MVRRKSSLNAKTTMKGLGLLHRIVGEYVHPSSQKLSKTNMTYLFNTNPRFRRQKRALFDKR